MFIWPAGDVTGAVYWDALEWLVRERPAESGAYAVGVPSEEGWARVAELIAEHNETIRPAEEPAAEQAAGEPPAEPEPPRRGPGRPRKEA